MNSRFQLSVILTVFGMISLAVASQSRTAMITGAPPSGRPLPQTGTPGEEASTANDSTETTRLADSRHRRRSRTGGARSRRSKIKIRSSTDANGRRRLSGLKKRKLSGLKKRKLSGLKKRTTTGIKKRNTSGLKGRYKRRRKYR